MRYHPCTILFRIYSLVKNSIFIAIFLFVLKLEDTSWYFVYGRYLFIAIILWRIVYIIVAWFFETYDWKDSTFYLQKGIFIKKTRTIPFSKIQNITKKTSIFHKIFRLTSLTFETSMYGEDHSIQFEVLSVKQADELTKLVQFEEQQIEETNEEEIDHITIHFTSNKKDLLKASFTSLSFLAIIPLVFAALENLEPFFPAEVIIASFFQNLTSNYLLLSLLTFLAIIFSIGFGIARTFIRYGNYEITSDKKYIYIKRGLLDESEFSIEKNKIQGVEIVQTFIKRLFGLAEVKIISSASPNDPDEKLNVNSLYPFLPIERAYRLIEELLPSYRCNVPLQRLPKIALWVKLLRPSWLGIIAAIALIYFKPTILKLEDAWIILIIVLFCYIIIQRIFDYKHTAYAIDGDQVQWWRGGLTAKMFMTKRKNIIEMYCSQKLLQRKFQLATITTLNRSAPTRIEVIADIPFSFAQTMESWYRGRTEDIDVVNEDKIDELSIS